MNSSVSQAQCMKVDISAIIGLNCLNWFSSLRIDRIRNVIMFSNNELLQQIHIGLRSWIFVLDPTKGILIKLVKTRTRQGVQPYSASSHALKC